MMGGFFGKYARTWTYKEEPRDRGYANEKLYSHLDLQIFYKDLQVLPSNYRNQIQEYNYRTAVKCLGNECCDCGLTYRIALFKINKLNYLPLALDIFNDFSILKSSELNVKCPLCISISYLKGNIYEFPGFFLLQFNKRMYKKGSKAPHFRCVLCMNKGSYNEVSEYTTICDDYFSFTNFKLCLGCYTSCLRNYKSVFRKLKIYIYLLGARKPKMRVRDAMNVVSFLTPGAFKAFGYDPRVFSYEKIIEESKFKDISQILK
jgi:hypothetical protein